MGAGFARSGPGGARFTHRASTGTRLVTAGLVAYLALTTALPLVALVATSLTRAPGLPPVPANWTVQNYTSGLGPTALASLGRTVTLAAAAAVVVTILAAVVVGLGGSSRRRLGTALTLGYAVPGTALAIGVLVAYGPWLGGSAAIILLAYLGKCAALGTGRWPPEPTGSPRSSARLPGSAAPTPPPSTGRSPPPPCRPVRRRGRARRPVRRA